DAGLEQVAAMQHLRHEDGSYWTGFVYPDDARWPVERTTWTAAAVVLAADALSAATPASRLFRDVPALSRGGAGSAADVPVRLAGDPGSLLP
ncbi:MAG: prenyltransferase, partial [Actinomycetota bacterium]|nr:prenyltransferase [Actinomycetota bacterium]